MILSDEDIIAKGFKPFHGNEKPADWDGGETMRATGAVVADSDPWWNKHYSSYQVIGYHPKKPNKIVIPDGPAPAWLTAFPR